MDRNTLVLLLQELIRIPSPNPPGDCGAMANFCASYLEDAGFAVVKAAPDNRAWSVVGTLGNDNGPSILLHAHTDTVPLGQNARWSDDPFAGVIRDGRVYGLGSVDDKAPLAAILQVAATLGQRQEHMQGKLVIVCAADEEAGGRLGTRWLVDTGYIPECDFAVVGEQTHNRVATAHKGVLRATFQVSGRTAHATNPTRGANAINGMAHLILDLEGYQRETLAARSHPLVGSPSISVGLIEGGVGATVVADRCSIRVDRRMIPGEDPQEVLAELTAIAVARQAVDPGRSYAVTDFLVSNWFQMAADAPLTQHLLRISAQETGTPAEPVGYLPGSDAKHLVPIVRQGMVVFGPGTYEVAHSTDEYTEISELETTYRILQRLVEETLLTTQEPSQHA